MTHILIPREPNAVLLRPFTDCPADELPLAWAAMVRAAEVQNARAGAAPAAVAPRARDLLGIVRTAQAEARRLINGEDSGSDLAQTKLDLPETLRVLEHALSQPAAVAGPATAGWRLVPAVPTREWIAAVADGGYEDCDCAQMIASILSHAPAAPALEAPAAPAGWKLVPVEPTQQMLEAAHTSVRLQGHRETYRAMLAAAPQAPAAPVVGDDVIKAAAIAAGAAKFYPDAQSKKPWTEDAFLVTGGFLQRFAGEISTTLKAPARPAVDATKELDPGLNREVYRACEDLPEGWSIRIDLENGYGSVKLIDPDGEENELPVDGWLSDAMRASIAAAQAAAKGA